MALELLPDGKTFRKLTATQSGALERYYKRAKGEPLDSKSMVLPASLIIVAGIGTIAYFLKDKLKLPEIDIPTWPELAKVVKGAAEGAGGVVADVITAGFTRLEQPITPEFIIQPDGVRIGPLSICQRWENDAAGILEKVQSGEYNTIIAALQFKRVIKGMKYAGCARPGAITQAQWDD